MTQLSIIVACFERTDLLEETLVAVLQQRPDDCEILVVHDGRYQDPYELTDEVQFISVEPGSGWIETIEAGWRASRGDLIHLLGAGVVPQVGWTKSAVAEFKDPAVGSVVPLVRDSRAPDKVRCVGVTVGACLGRKLVGAGREAAADQIRRLKPLGPNLVASFYRSAALEAVGGLTSNFGDELCDVDLARRIAEVGYETSIVAECDLSAGPIDHPRSIGAKINGRDHQRLINSWTQLPAWRRWLASGWQIALETATSPRSPSRLASVWGRLGELRAKPQVIPQSLEAEPTVLSIHDHRQQLTETESHEYHEESQSRRAA